MEKSENYRPRHAAENGRDRVPVPARPRRSLTLASAAALLAGSAAVAVAGTPPAGPGNIEIFNKRSMVALEGYTAYAGDPVTIDLLRDNEVIATARGELDETGFFEVNHPGGGCWIGATPFIKPGDEVRMKVDGQPWTDSAITASPTVTAVTGSGFTPSGEVLPGDPDTRVRGRGTVTITGTYDPADPWFSPERFNIETVNPDNKDDKTPLGEDPGLVDARAMGISLVPDAEHPNGVAGAWDAEAVAEGTTITGTYTLYTQADYDRTLEGDHVFAAWMAGEEPALGLTQNEYEEIPGPGMGGCPPSPDGGLPTAPSSAIFASEPGSGSIAVAWTPATQPADASEVTGYRVSAVGPPHAEQEVAERTGGTSVNLDGLVEGAVYEVFIEAFNGRWSVEPQTLGTVTVGSGTGGTPPPPPPGEEPPAEPVTTAPEPVTRLAVGTAGPTSVSLTWTASPAAEIVTEYRVQAFTADGATPVGDPVTATTPAATVAGLSAATEYQFQVVAVNAHGASSPATVQGTTAAWDAPGAFDITRVVSQHEAALVEWSPSAPGNAPLSGYTVTLTNTADATQVHTVRATGTQATVSGLTNGQTYRVAVAATSAGGTTAAGGTFEAAPAEVVTVDRATVRVRSATSSDWVVRGTSTDTSANTITITRTDGRLIGTAPVVADGAWSYSARNNVAPLADNKVVVTSSNGTRVTATLTRVR